MMSRRELLAAMAAATVSPMFSRAEGLLPPAMEEMVVLDLRMTAEMRRTIELAAFYDGVTVDEYIAGCLRELIDMKQAGELPG